ncbi:MAG TPA: HAMP domain-containing sensor histidine kinase [Polyangiaceae bacterium]|nr:HAMP domain-containing sensor histidine kinase [Polyangiaceae bacterium]
MSKHRDEILDTCYAELLDTDQGIALAHYVEDFFDEMTRAVKRDSGIRDSTSSLPQTSDTAARFGVERQRAGLPVTRLPALYSAISQALGKTGERYDLQITAEEYKILNRCLDAGVATSLENFWQGDKERESKRITESFGFFVHEMRNALSNTNIAFKLLRTGALDVNGQTANIVARNLARLDTLIAQCMSTVQFEVGALPDPVPVDVSSTLRNLEAAIIPDRGIHIDLELEEELLISGDEMLLSSAISNLLQNAIKFSHSSSVVRLRARATADRVLISVEDQCGGLNQEDPEELFEPYVKRREGSAKGTGLGLTISRRAVRSMGGELNVADRPGLGCVFTASFPAFRR